MMEAQYTLFVADSADHVESVLCGIAESKGVSATVEDGGWEDHNNVIHVKVDGAYEAVVAFLRKAIDQGYGP